MRSTHGVLDVPRNLHATEKPKRNVQTQLMMINFHDDDDDRSIVFASFNAQIHEKKGETK